MAEQPQQGQENKDDPLLKGLLQNIKWNNEHWEEEDRLAIERDLKAPNSKFMTETEHLVEEENKPEPPQRKRLTGRKNADENKKARMKAEERAGYWLALANEADEKGQTEKAKILYEKSQHWMDRMNQLLRNN